MEYLFYELKQIPDLTLAKYQSLGESGVEGVLEKHAAFLRQWQRISIICNAGIHLLILYNPKEEIGQKINIAFAITSKNRDHCSGQAIL